MATMDQKRREELLEARAKILRQLDICQNNPPSNFYDAQAGGGSPASPVPNLMATLKEIEDALADIEKDDA